MKNLVTKTLLACGTFMLCMSLYGCDGTPTGPEGQRAGGDPPPGYTPAPAPDGDLPAQGMQGGGGARGGN